MGICITVFPLSLIWWNSGFFFKKKLCSRPRGGLNGTTILAYSSLRFARSFSFETGKRYLQAQSIYHAGTYVLIIATPINMYFNWLLVLNRSTSLWFNGSAVSLCISSWLIPFLMGIFAKFIDGMKCLTKYKISDLFLIRNRLVRMIIPSVIMMEASIYMPSD